MNTGLNEHITEYLQRILSDEETQQYFDFLEQNHSVYIRVNELKADRKKVADTLKGRYGIETEEVENIPYALKIVKDEVGIGKTVEHILGHFYLQSLSSMIPPIVLNPSAEDRVLDLCAAPGSKSTQLAQIMENRGTLVCNEIQADRLGTLVFNTERMNLLNTGVIHQRGEWLSKSYGNHFDKVLVDAPCSGLGILQKKEEVNKWWNVSRAENLADIQQRLLVSGIKMLRTGGELVYSTCTMTVEENEMLLDKVLKKYPLEIVPIEVPVPTIEGKTTYLDYIFEDSITLAKRILPWAIDSEGFFVVKLRKTDDIQAPKQDSPPSKDITYSSYKKMKKHLSLLQETFGVSDKDLERFMYLKTPKNVFILNSDWDDPSPTLFKKVGLRLGNFDRNDQIILHSTAAQVLAPYMTRNVFNVENSDDLRSYLGGGIIKGEFPYKGHVAVKWEGEIIGTAASTGNGIKSRFPRAHRTQEIYVAD